MSLVLKNETSVDTPDTGYTTVFVDSGSLKKKTPDGVVADVGGGGGGASTGAAGEVQISDGSGGFTSSDYLRFINVLGTPLLNIGIGSGSSSFANAIVAFPYNFQINVSMGGTKIGYASQSGFVFGTSDDLKVSGSAGTAGQVLTTGGSGASTTWSSVASVDVISSAPTARFIGDLWLATDANGGAGALCFWNGTGWIDSKTSVFPTV